VKSTYVSVTETAKLVRGALKKAFPGVKFSVKSDKYAGGASIDVRWTDGPCSAAVEPVAKQFQGGGFDGMIDLKFGRDSWLSPDGTAMTASDEGTAGSGGVYGPVRNWMPDPDAKLVHFGADFIFCNRTISPALLTRARDRLAAKGYPVEVVEIVVSDYGDAYVKTLTYDQQKTRGFDMEREIMAAAHKTHCCAGGK